MSRYARSKRSLRSSAFLNRSLLTLEELETRWVPADYKWSPDLLGDRNWSTIYPISFVGPIPTPAHSNWLKKDPAGFEYKRSSIAPGNADSIWFDGRVSNRDCIVDAAFTL